MYDDHPTNRRKVGRIKKRWKNLHPYRWNKSGTAYTRLLLIMVTKCRIYSWKNKYICYVTVFRHVTSYTLKHMSTHISMETTTSSGIAYYRTYLYSAWCRIPEEINFITTTVNAWNFKFIFTLLNEAHAKSDYIAENNKKEP